MAQQTAGSIVGKVQRGEVVVVENSSIGINRQTAADDNGTFTFGQLPAGTYKVTVTRAGGAKETTEVSVSAGLSATASFIDQQRVVVTGTALRTVDMASVNSSFVVSKAEIDRTPVAQNVTAVTLLAPGAVQGEGGFGTPGARSANLASINGSSVAENAYYINGFNVTNINKGIAFNEVPFEAIGEVQVLNGGYGVEFGRSLGGVVSVNTKRGTNEWKGGAILSWAPNTGRGTPVYADKSEKTGFWNLVEKPGESERVTANAYMGGPLIKDQLYMFALVEGRYSNDKTYGQDNHVFLHSTSPKYLTKFDWNLTQNHLLELTLFSDKVEDRQRTYAAVSPYTTEEGTFKGTDLYTTGGTNTILKWTGSITDNLTLSALVGRGKYSRGTSIESAGCPVVQDRRVTAITLGCWTSPTGQVDVPNASDVRDAYRFDLDWTLGKHTIRAGLDHEKYTTIDGAIFSGNAAYRLLTLPADGSISSAGYTNTTGAPLDYVRYRFFKNGGTFKTINSAWYLEDSFKPVPEVVLTGGVRSESFENQNDSGGVFIKVKNTISPRGGFAWDLGGKGTTKVFGNLGRYYIPVYSNTNVRLSGAESFYEEYYEFKGLQTDAKQTPNLGAQLGNRVTFSDGSPKDPRSVVDPGIKPLFQDEWILGFEHALNDRWSVGAKWTNRRLKNGMDDICEGDLVRSWATGAGFSTAQAGRIASAVGNCFLYNPGGDLTANVNLNNDGTLVPVRIPASVLQMPKPERKYDSLELMATRQWDKKWSAQGSLVIAWSRGNTEGYVKSDNQQDDAGLTTDFDHPGLMEGAYGWLPNDRRYTLKLSGAYALNDEWRVSGTLVSQSGRPLNCFGTYEGPLPDASADYGAASYYCRGVLKPRGSAGRLNWMHDINLQFQYTPTAIKGLTLKADVFNLLNRRTIRAVDERVDADTPGVDWVDYQRPRLSGVQSARSFRFTAAYEF